ncbi:SRPBCC family protein [Streptomyces sp. NPDC050560]|uniref:SRPBCC family protein n=1 Tax=Streptomyces sp. NPDC050560 TaxID=3365630 RepID=UPI0037AEF6AD
MPERKKAAEAASPLEDLRSELLEYLGSLGRHVVGKATDRLGSLADPGKLLPGDGGSGGGVGEALKRSAQGENPVAAFAKGKAKDARDKAVGAVKGAVGMDSGGKAGDLKAINIIEHVDIGRPLRWVYDHFTEFEEFGSFMNGVSSVSRDDEDETKSTWKVRVWPSTRSYDATVYEQLPDERIAWTSEGSKGTTNGVVSFHYLDECLTRVTVVVEYYPSGFVEKTGNIWRAQGRRLRLDLKHFQRYVTLQEDEVDGWRGEIRDGEVVRGHDEAVEEERAREEEREDGEGGYEDERGDDPDGEDDRGDRDDGEGEEEDGEDGEDEDAQDEDGAEAGAERSGGAVRGPKRGRR